jgi:ribose 5-phosphate isomerase
MKAQENKRQQEDKKMITINSRNELDTFLYGADSISPDTLVGIARIGGELLSEALTNELSDGTFHIGEFFPMGDEGEGITVDRDGNILEDFLYY